MLCFPHTPRRGYIHFFHWLVPFCWFIVDSTMASTGPAGGSGDQKLAFKVVFASSEEPDNPATELDFHSPQTKGWQSTRYEWHATLLGLLTAFHGTWAHGVSVNDCPTDWLLIVTSFILPMLQVLFVPARNRNCIS
jgi:hypothetical protein